MNTPYGEAWERYATSKWGQGALEPTTLGAAADQAKYLENRIKSAFAEGWNSHKDYCDNRDSP